MTAELTQAQVLDLTLKDKEKALAELGKQRDSEPPSDSSQSLFSQTIANFGPG
jgi:hypothetical protein